MGIIKEQCASCGAPININRLSHINDIKIECPHCHSIFIKEAKHSKIGAEKEAKIEIIQEQEKWHLTKVKSERDAKNEQSRNDLKTTLILLASFLTFFIFVGIYFHVSTRDTIEVTEINKVFKGKNYKKIQIQLSDMGFKNIKTEKLEDLKLGFLTKDGEVEQVTINGESNYESGDRFKPDAKVTILYHTFKKKT